MRRNRSRGSTTVQLAVALPLLVSLFLSTWQFGYSYYLYNELEQAVRAGARYGSRQAYDGTHGDLSTITTAVQKMVVYGDPAAGAGATPLVSGLATSNVAVSFTPNNGRPLTVQVNIRDYSTGTFWSIIPSNKPSAQFPYLGIYTGS